MKIKTLKKVIEKHIQKGLSVADPGFDLRGAWTFSTGGGVEKSLKVSTFDL